MVSEGAFIYLVSKPPSMKDLIELVYNQQSRIF